MNTGKMRHRVDIQSPTNTTSDYGGVSVVWKTEKTVWAFIKPLKADEIIKNLRVDMRVTHKIIIWYYSSLKPSWRVKYNDRTFNINSILNDEENNKSMTILAEETVDG